ncbi:MAG: hypothetical protein Q9182_004050 [Xanthomendoza sp. 2 TL-2023]
MAASNHLWRSDIHDFTTADGPPRDIELENNAVQAHTGPPSRLDTVQPAVPPADHGSAAWIFLAGCFIAEALVWGLPFSYGVFQQYYSTHEPFASQPRNIAAVGTITTGFMYLLQPLVALASQRWQQIRRPIAVVGHSLLLIGLISASFANRISELIITQGIIYGVGGALLYTILLIYLDQWFIARKGLAYGVLWAGTGLGGAAVPLIFNWSLERYGFRTSLRMWAVVVFIFLTPLVILIKPRLPLPEKGEIRPLNLRFLRQKLFWVLQLGNIIEGLGYFVPSIYLLTFGSTHLHLRPIPATLVISVLNLSSVAGTILIGYLIDHLAPSSVILISSLGAALSIFLLWGFAISQPVIYIFAIAYGIFAGGYSATWTGYVSEIQRNAREADAGIVIAILGAGRGLGSVSSGLISEALLGYGGWKHLRGVYGTEYGVLIIFTGVTAVVGGLGFLMRFRFRGVGGESVASTMEIRMAHEETR